VKETALLQLYVELRAADPEAVSARGVARERLAAGRRLAELRRLRVFELAGELPGRAEAQALFDRSTWFYNPVKERATVRDSAAAPAPFSTGESLVLVVDRGLERRAAAERWWRHETGVRAEVREAVVWGLTFAGTGDAEADATSLAVTADRAHGLFANPHFQDWRLARGDAPPWPWLGKPKRTRKE